MDQTYKKKTIKTLNNLWSILVLASFIAIIVFAFLNVNIIVRQVLWYVSFAVMISSFFKKDVVISGKHGHWEHGASIVFLSAFSGVFLINVYVTEHQTLGWLWYAFCLFFIATSVFTICLSITAWRKSDKSKSAKNNIIVNVLKILAFNMLIDWFYMTFIIDNLLLRFIIGCIIILVVLCTLIISFLGSPRLSKYFLIYDFAVGIGLTIYLLYLIPTSFGNLQTIATTIIATIYSGLFTLVGVAWTIKKGDRDKKAEERKKYFPHFIPLSNEIYRGSTHGDMPIIDPALKQAKGIVLRDWEFNTRDVAENFSVVAIYLRNISPYPCAIEKIFVNEIEFSAASKIWIEKESAFYIQLEGATQNFYNNKNKMLIYDMLGNKYRYEIVTNEIVLDQIEENQEVL